MVNPRTPAIDARPSARFVPRLVASAVVVASVSMALEACSSDPSSTPEPAPACEPAGADGPGGAGGGRPDTTVVEEFVPSPCIARVLTLDAANRVSCTIFEAVHAVDGASPCTAPGRRPYCDADAIEASKSAPGFSAGQWNEFCEIVQLSGSELHACQFDLEEPSSATGFCYIEATHTTPVANPALVEDCPITEKRRIRFIGTGDLPRLGGALFIVCTG